MMAYVDVSNRTDGPRCRVIELTAMIAPTRAVITPVASWPTAAPVDEVVVGADVPVPVPLPADVAIVLVGDDVGLGLE